MTSELWMLLMTAASIGFVHTISGPDHYLPFVVLGRAGGWSARKTLGLTAVCGAAHVASSVLIGGVGMVAGFAFFRLVEVETLRGDVAVLLLVAFGTAYTLWGLYRARRNGSHSHQHPGDTQDDSVSMSFWGLFIIFVLGPCEPLIPLMMVAARNDAFGLVAVTLVFGGVTIATMLAAVAIGSRTLGYVPTGPLQRYAHAMAGAAILLCGLALALFDL